MRTRLGSLLATAAVGLALAPSAFADTATADLNLTLSACSGSSDVLALSYDFGAYSGNCGSIPGIAVLTDTYPSGTLPAAVTIDPARPIAVAIDLKTQGGLPAFGEQTVGVDFYGTNTKGKTVNLGRAEEVRPADEMLTGGSYVQEFTLPLTAAQAGTYKSFSLDLSVGGAINGGYVGHGGLSYVSVPVVDGTVLVPDTTQ